MVTQSCRHLWDRKARSSSSLRKLKLELSIVDVGDQKIIGDNKYQSWVVALFHEVTFFDFVLLQMPLDDP